VSSPISLKTLVLPVQVPLIFFFLTRDVQHFPHISVSQVILHQMPQQFLYIQSIRFYSLRSAIYLHTRWVHHDVLDPCFLQVPVHPEPIQSGFITALDFDLFSQSIFLLCLRDFYLHALHFPGVDRSYPCFPFLSCSESYLPCALT
jgi:hypothetical protein